MRVIWYSMLGAILFTVLELHASWDELPGIAPIGNIIAVWALAIGVSVHTWLHDRRRSGDER